MSYVRFGDVCRPQLGMQSQYASEYILGRGRKPAFGEGLRFRNWPNTGGDYHSIEIHEDDVAEFVRRVQEFRKKIGQI